MIALRPYQVDAIDSVRGLIRTGRRRILVCSPTGSGKTVIASEIVRSAATRGNGVLFIAHRKELLDQTVDKLARFGVPAGVIMADDPRRNDALPVQVCSVQTLARRADRPPAQLLIIDEAHHATSDSYRKILDAYPGVVVIGLTATPWRTDGVSLADLFDASVLAATPAELMKKGSLVEYDGFAYDAPDLHAVGVVGGEYKQGDLEIACNTSVLVGSIVREYLEHARGRRGIVFPVTCDHSRNLVAEFRAAGVIAEHVDAETPKPERERILNGLATGEVTLVSSVGVLSEGFDSPAAEVAILARPTKSLSLHLQCIGRVLRPSPSTGKTRALIHDHAGNLLRHGLPDDERDYSLTAVPTLVREPRTCPECRAVLGRLRDGHCPHCGEFIAPPEEEESAGAGRAGTLIVDGRRISVDEIRSLRAQRADHGYGRALTDEQLVRAARATPEERAAEYKRLLVVADRKGFRPGFAAHQFRITFGKWPRFREDMLERVDPAARPFFPLPPRSASRLDPPGAGAV